MQDALIDLLTGIAVKSFVEQYGELPPAQWLNPAQKAFGTEARHVLEYMQLRQKARLKVPNLAEKWLFSSKSFEQATSALVAQYKADRFRPQNYTDLTAGAGIDAWFMSKYAQSVYLVEADPLHAALLKHNFAGTTAQILAGDAAELLTQLPGGDLVYLDPDRRPSGQRVYGFETAQPQVLELLPELKTRYQRIILKASPMADVHQCVEQLPGVHRVLAIVSNGELKELVFEIAKRNDVRPMLEAVWLQPDGQAHS